MTSHDPCAPGGPTGRLHSDEDETADCGRVSAAAPRRTSPMTGEEVEPQRRDRLVGAGEQFHAYGYLVEKCRKPVMR